MSVPRLVDLPFSVGTRIIDRWGEALHRAALTGQPLPSLSEPRFYTHLEAREPEASLQLPEMSQAS
jgi:hypothetical protein